jgi:hypothetical protein
MTSSTLPISFKRAQRLTGTVPRYGPNIITPVTPDLVWRATTQGSRIAIQSFNNASALSRTTRNRIVLPVPTRYIQIAIPVFNMVGSNPIIDTLFAGAQAKLWFQVGIEYPYTEAVTGLAPRTPIRFNGLDYATYDNVTWNGATGWLYSDPLDLGFTIPSFTAFGRWVTVEVENVGVNVLPISQNSSNFIPRNTGTILSSTSQIIGRGGATNAALTATSVSPHTPLQTGSADFYDPCVMRVMVLRNTKSTVTFGDSITYGVGEGASGSGAFGDPRGDVYGNAGIMDRGLWNAGILNVNFGKGSDGYKYMGLNDTYWQYRRQIVPWCDPTHVISSNIHNDITQTASCGAWVGDATRNVGDALTNGGNIYIYTASGKAALSGGPSGTGGVITDGTAVCAYFGPASGANTMIALQIGRQVRVHWLIKGMLPVVPILAMCGTPDATSTDSWATAGNQTAVTGWGNAASRRGLWNDKIETRYPPLQLAGYLDPNPYLEDSFPTETSKWVSGSAFYATNDGTHPNSKGYDLASIPMINAAITAGYFS